MKKNLLQIVVNTFYTPIYLKNCRVAFKPEHKQFSDKFPINIMEIIAVVIMHCLFEP